VAHRFPFLRYAAAQLLIFLASLLMGRPLEDAYEAATGQLEPRNAWRWMKRLMLKLTDFRCFLKAHLKPSDACIQLKKTSPLSMVVFGKFYDRNLGNKKIVTMRIWQNGRKSSKSYDR
jgi:hypothetical protein